MIQKNMFQDKQELTEAKNKLLSNRNAKYFKSPVAKQESSDTLVQMTWVNSKNDKVLKQD
jgi:hypothetical protein